MAEIVIENPRHRRHRRKRNPATSNPRRHRRHAKKRNPGVTSIQAMERRVLDNPKVGLSMGRVIGLAVPATGGLIGTRVATRAILGPNDKGLYGYLANGGIAFAGGGILYLLKAHTIAKLIWVGGAIAILLRGISEAFPSISKGLMDGYGQTGGRSAMLPSGANLVDQVVFGLPPQLQGIAGPIYVQGPRGLHEYVNRSGQAIATGSVYQPGTMPAVQVAGATARPIQVISGGGGSQFPAQTIVTGANPALIQAMQGRPISLAPQGRVNEGFNGYGGALAAMSGDVAEYVNRTRGA